MTAAQITAAVHDAGLLVLVDGADLVVKPVDRITPAVRAMLIEAKAEVVEYLQACERITPVLMHAAMQACDKHGDSEQRREEMRADVLATPLHLRLDLMHHFQQTYGQGVSEKLPASILPDPALPSFSTQSHNSPALLCAHVRAREGVSR